MLWEQFSRTLRPRHTSRLGRSSLGLLQADAAVGRAAVGAVVGGNGVVDGEDDAVNRGAFEVGDGPGVGGGHGGGVVGSGSEGD